jgi:PTS system mannose-specific IIC component
MVWGAVTGDMGLALSVSLVFELLWLDLMPAGTFIPPNNAAANLAALALIKLFGIDSAGMAVYVVVLCLPIAILASRLEQVQRRMQNASYNKLLTWTKISHVDRYNPGRLVAGSMVQSVVLNLLFFIFAASAAAGVMHILLSSGRLDAVEEIRFGHLWLAAALGGVLALRRPRAYWAATAAGVLVLAAAGLS